MLDRKHKAFLKGDENKKKTDSRAEIKRAKLQYKKK